MDADQGRSVLSNTGWLRQTPSEFQTAVLDLAVWRRFATDEEMICAGDDRMGGMFGVAEGVVSIAPTEDAPPLIIRAVVWTGWGVIWTGNPRYVSLRARSTVSAALIPYAPMTALLAARPDWWRWLGLVMIENDQRTLQVIADMMIPDVRRRCIAMLLHACGCRHGDASHVTAETVITQQELATMANLSRFTVRNILEPLANQGLIELGYRHLKLRAPAALRSMIANP